MYEGGYNLTITDGDLPIHLTCIYYVYISILNLILNKFPAATVFSVKRLSAGTSTISEVVGETGLALWLARPSVSAKAEEKTFLILD